MTGMVATRRRRTSANTRPRSRQAIHNIRDHLGTVATNLELLGLERDLSDKGRSALVRIDTALAEICQELEGLRTVPGITIYGPQDPSRRTSLVSFNLAGHDPVDVAEALNKAGVESRAGCHCATLAHRALRLDPPASCRLSFYLYNTPDEVDQAVAAVAASATGRGQPARPWYQRLFRPAQVRPAPSPISS